MSPNPLPVLDMFDRDLFEERVVPREADALGLQACLQDVFAPEGPEGDVTPNPDTGTMGENIRDLCEALLQVTVEAKKASDGVESRFESLSATMAALSGYVASQRQEIQANSAAIQQVSEQLKQLQDDVAAQRGGLEALKNQVAPVTSQMATATAQVADLEDTVTTLAHSSVRYSEGLSVLDNALEAAKTQLYAMCETSAYLTERLKIAEQAAESSARRDKIMAELHARAARTLQLGQ